MNFLVADGESLDDSWKTFIENASKPTEDDDETRAIANGVRRVLNARAVLQRRPNTPVQASYEQGVEILGGY